MRFCPQLEHVYMTSKNAASVLGNTVYVRILNLHIIQALSKIVIYKRLEDGAIQFIQALQDITFVLGFGVGNAIYLDLVERHFLINRFSIHFTKQYFHNGNYQEILKLIKLMTLEKEDRKAVNIL